MPGGDGTGPWWAGGRWGCRRGFGPGFGRGFGRGFGPGFGPRQLTKEEEKKMLEDELKAIKQRLDELK